MLAYGSSTFRFSASRAARITVSIRASARRLFNETQTELGEIEFVIEDLLSNGGKGIQVKLFDYQIMTMP
jgi:hypothetical protein